MKRLLAALLLAAWPAAAQRSIPAAPCKITDGSCAPMPNATTLGCAANSVAVFLGTPVALSCDGGLTYDATTDVLTAGALAARNVTATALATPGAITVTNQGTPGGTTVTYKLVALLADGTTTEAGAASSTATSNATLSASNFNRLTWSAVTGATSYRVYRTVAPTSPNTTGIVYSGTALTVDDTGLAGGGETAPTSNGTGILTGAKLVLSPAAATATVGSGNTGTVTVGKITSATDTYQLNAAGLYLGNVQVIAVSSTAGATSGAKDTYLYRSNPGEWTMGGTGSDAAAKLRLAQLTISGANGDGWLRGYSTELVTLSTSGATTDTSANLLPANAIIEAVVARITTTITTATDWKLGDATTPGRFTTANSTLAAGTTDVGLVHVDQTGAAGPRQTTAAKVRVTTTGTPGAGVIRVTVFYRQFIPPAS